MRQARPDAFWARDEVTPTAKRAEVLATEPAVRVTLVGPRGILAQAWHQSPIVVGRTAQCDWPVDDAWMSREHATLYPEPGAVRVVDRDSRNGVWLGAAQVAQTLLGDGGVVRIADHLLLVEVGARPTAPINGDRSLARTAMDDRLARASRTRAPLLLLGPTGAGKTWIARAFAALLGEGRPFVAVNCAELAPSLMEAELFGAARGAYTGNDRARDGLVVAADGGVLFLDEIGTLPLEQQAKLLHVLETGEVRPVGSARSRSARFHLVSATNEDLEAAVVAGRFRADLYFRLCGSVVQVPALRQSRLEIPALFRGFAGLDAEHALPPDVLETLVLHPWHGNLRQLRHVAAATLGGQDWSPVLELRAEALAAACRAGVRDGGVHPVERDPRPEMARGDRAGVEPGADTEGVDDAAVTHDRFIRVNAATPVAGQPALRDRGRDAGRPGPKVDRPTPERLAALLDEHRNNVSAVARALGKAPTQIRRWLRELG